MFRIASINGHVLPQKLQNEFPDIEFYESGSTMEACEIAQELTAQGRTDAIICVTGIAKFVRRVTELPVFVSDPSRFDILQALREASLRVGDPQERIAIIIHSDWEIDLEPLRSWIDHEVDLYRYSSEEQISGIVLDAHRQGAGAVVGGPDVLNAARTLDIPAVFLQVGIVSFRSTIRRTLAALENVNRVYRYNQRLTRALDLTDDANLFVNGRGFVINANENARRLFQLKSPKDDRSVYMLLSSDERAKDFLDRRSCKNELIHIGAQEYFLSIETNGEEGDAEEMVVSLKSAESVESMEREYRRLQTTGMVAKYDFGDILTRNPTMNAVKELAKAYAATNATILIRGETGSGKELFANGIHRHSAYRKGPFVAVNCAAIPEDLLESELFGYEEGAFTGARKAGKAGLFELAHGGTIFLDEISQVPLRMQGAVLRVLQERQLLRVGGSHVIPINVRVVAACNEDLLALARQGKIRWDLYYRLNTLSIAIPPLRNRKEDILYLFQHYFHIFCRMHGEAAPMSREAIALLQQYPWPGNVRELMHCAERYVLASRCIGKTAIDFVREYLQEEQFGEPEAERPAVAEQAEPQMPPPEDVGPEAETEEAPAESELRIPLGTLEAMDACIARAAFSRCGSSKKRTAALLEISLPTLQRHLSGSSERPADPTARSVGIRIGALRDMEAAIFREAIAACGGSKTDAAQLLGVSRSTLWKRLQEQPA